jgi:(p)ppGpp synthase/HD superfamily hydrolase
MSNAAPPPSAVDHPTVEDSAALAGMLHAAQVDKAGAPYIGHLARVSRHLRLLFPDATEAERHAAWLHDSIEDAGMTRERLLALGYAPEVIATIEAVTKPADGTPYQQWIERIADSGDVSAMRVKRADLGDNADPARLTALPADRAAALRAKYGPAIAAIEAGLARAGGR